MGCWATAQSGRMLVTSLGLARSSLSVEEASHCDTAESRRNWSTFYRQGGRHSQDGPFFRAIHSVSAVYNRNMVVLLLFFAVSWTVLPMMAPP
jgi:hypothetical protein